MWSITALIHIDQLITSYFCNAIKKNVPTHGFDHLKFLLEMIISKDFFTLFHYIFRFSEIWDLYVTARNILLLNMPLQFRFSINIGQQVSFIIEGYLTAWSLSISSKCLVCVSICLFFKTPQWQIYVMFVHVAQHIC